MTETIRTVETFDMVLYFICHTFFPENADVKKLTDRERKLTVKRSVVSPYTSISE